MTKLKGKIIWITGASSGIGKALSIQAVRAGAKVLLSARNKDKLEELKQQLENLSPGSTTILPMDVTKPEDISKNVQIVKDTFGKVDILINNAGISQRSLAEETPLEVDRLIFETDFFSAVMLTKSVLPLMLQGNGAHLVAISSMTGLFGYPMRSAYSAAKHALRGFFETLAIELKDKNINVTIVYPGRIHTDISLSSLTKDGSRYGIMDRAQEKGIPVDKCARKIIRAIEKNKKHLMIGFPETCLYYVKIFFPALFYNIALKAGRGN